MVNGSEERMWAEAGTSKRHRILEQVLEVFVENGYVGTTTDQLAAAASASKQTFYKEFGDKEGVFTALIAYACDRVDDRSSRSSSGWRPSRRRSRASSCWRRRCSARS
ncbi:MAG TPA: TetR/AcrR family transcriptional regulator [Actinotalea caeni]|uniref:TetR/AcrR family transcriptional regulator n=1 Tax=Actinotalea caeni TaxID=1348467 RepID=UPI002B4B72ED|nr:TetR/AcrR family transcriptional regulator [Actinotalea caeni]HLV55510.1 TetR/AcrR family transcriptional regulator [Actinotalea caeni]